MHPASTLSFELAALVVYVGITRPARRFNYIYLFTPPKKNKPEYVSYVITTKLVGDMYVPGV